MNSASLGLIKRHGDRLHIEGHIVCMATHPCQPNRSGHARGRKMHLTLDGKKTLCNMKYDKYLSANNFPRNECKICFKTYNHV